MYGNGYFVYICGTDIKTRQYEQADAKFFAEIETELKGAEWTGNFCSYPVSPKEAVEHVLTKCFIGDYANMIAVGATYRGPDGTVKYLGDSKVESDPPIPVRPKEIPNPAWLLKGPIK